ncbi:hypothetical protein BARBAKC583_0015 [Bartonella bacilliformis KC583]|uniref:Uncharacterized protein n=2 Tax=Bartonella bacilliformis TaxID=774 RepID=A1UQV1_BARBK|nr:hypothetical protein BARBAKC583_0015 [Bartonella bacilliformis KC583]
MDKRFLPSPTKKKRLFLAMLKITLHVFFILLFPFATYAQETIKNEPDGHFILTPTNNPKIVANYPLTENFLEKMEKAKQKIINLPPELQTSHTENDHSIEGLIAFVSSRPHLKEILDNNGLTPKDYVIGFIALQATLIAVTALEDTDAFFDETTTVFQDNLKFGQKHINRIRAFLDY